MLEFLEEKLVTSVSEKWWAGAKLSTAPILALLKTVWPKQLMFASEMAALGFCEKGNQYSRTLEMRA